jgi:hypothetical protein
VATLSDRLSDVLGQAIVAALIALVVAVIALWVDRGSLLSRFDGVEQLLTELRVDFREFRRPGERFTAEDGKRQQKQIDGLSHIFNVFSSGGSRALPLLIQIQAQIDECKEDMDNSRDNWIQCIRLHENMEPRLHSLEQRE